MHRRHLALFVLAPLLVVGAFTACSSDDGDADTSGPSTQLTLLPTTTTTVPASTTTSTTTTSTVPTTSTTTTIEAAPPTTVDPTVEALVLRDQGIGSAEFGSDPDGVIGFIGSFLGEPTGDTGWIDPFELGACPGTEIRQVSWGALTLSFGDASNVREGRRHFVSYGYGIDGEVGATPVGLRTEQGISVGSRVVDVIGAYPSAALFPEDDFAAPSFVVNDNLRGLLTGLDDDAAVTVIFGGQGCSE